MSTLENNLPNLESEKASIYAAYGRFSDLVSPFVDRLTGSVHASIEDVALVNKGQNVSVFQIELDGKYFVAKVPAFVRSNSSDLVSNVVEASIRVKNIPGYERIIAASPDGIIVSEKVEGTDLADISPEDLNSVTDDQIDNYVQAIIDGHAKGIAIDPKPANVMYDREKGFTIVDFTNTQRSSDSYKANPKDALSWGLEPFIYGGTGDGDRGEVISDPVRRSEIAKIKLPIIEKYIKSVEQQLDEAEQDVLFPNIDSALQHLQREAFDMEGLIAEREAVSNQRKMSSRKYDPAVDGELDSFV